MNALNKKMMRTMLQSRTQVLAVAAVVLCGTASYIAMSTCHLNLLLTRDTYYAEGRFADFEIMLERVPNTVLFKLEEIPGVRQVRGRIVEEVKLEIEGVEDTRTGRVISMPDTRQPVLNDVVVMSGRYFDPGAQNEVILSERFGQANGLEPGDNLEVTIDGKKHTLRIVGLGLSPEYIYIIRNVQEMVPAPERFGILWVPEEWAESAMNIQETSNNIVGSVDDPEHIDAILEHSEDILESYGVFSKVARENQISNLFVTQEIKGLGTTATIASSVFLSIAALVILILLNRMVRNERTQIGLIKAYGYSNFAVGAHYLQFALIISVAGAIGGFVLGQWMASGMIKMYNDQFYNFPVLRNRVYPEVLARAIGLSVIFSLLGAVVAARRAARINPAESMRPEAPVIGHRTWVERISGVWRRLSFTNKMIVRNVGRAKFRAALNVAGVMISSGTLIVGLFAMDGMDYIIEFEFEQTQRQDAKISFVVERGKDALYEAQRFKHVREAEPVLQYPFEMRNGWRTKDVVIQGFTRDASLHRLTDTEGRPVTLPDDGLVLSKNLANVLEAAPGDVLTLKPLMGKITDEKRVPVAQVVQQYFGMAGYMDIDALSRVLDEPYALNAVLLRTESGMASALHEELKDVPVVTSVEIKEDAIKGLEDTIQASMWIMSFITVLFAGIISFAIIYNVTTVSLAERERELASLRVLGFTKQEVGKILFHENFLTGALGLLLGVPFGMAICYGMTHAYPEELFTMPYRITPRAIGIASALTVGFIVIANLAVRRKIHRLNIVETLKQRE